MAIGENTPIGRAFRQERRTPDVERWQQALTRLREYTVVLVRVSNQVFALHRQFAAHRDLLREVGVDVAFAGTGFFEPYEVNGPALSEQLRRIFAEHGEKPLVLLTNPQTGPESLHATLKDPSLVTENIVARLVLIQPAFGTPLVDLPVRVFEDWPGAQGAVQELFGGLIDKFSAERTRQRFDDALEGLSERERSRVDERVFYVRSFTPSLVRTNAAFAATYPLLSWWCGRNDGVTCTEDQKLEGLGRDLGVVPADHWDLYAAWPVANSWHTYRNAFVRALVPLLFEGSDVRADDLR
jgi:hypothetical protein